jgi:lipopolysaccharide/colanic/teichoic acid biosynthesis glycosyltransferase
MSPVHHTFTQRTLKRGFDVLVGGVLALATLPLVAVCAALTKLASPGPAVLRQPREGAGGQPFLMYKIRTMYADAETLLSTHFAENPEADAEWLRYRRLAHDPRVAGRVGRLLRRTSLDELPQLWNVLRGEMTLVGPRPLELEVVENLDPGHLRLRRTVKPGLTGLWQVSGRSDLDLNQLQEIDAAYIRGWSFGLDLRILGRTPGVLRSGWGAY